MNSTLNSLYNKAKCYAFRGVELSCNKLTEDELVIVFNNGRLEFEYIEYQKVFYCLIIDNHYIEKKTISFDEGLKIIESRGDV